MRSTGTSCVGAQLAAAAPARRGLAAAACRKKSGRTAQRARGWPLLVRSSRASHAGWRGWGRRGSLWQRAEVITRSPPFRPEPAPLSFSRSYTRRRPHGRTVSRYCRGPAHRVVQAQGFAVRSASALRLPVKPAKATDVPSQHGVGSPTTNPFPRSRRPAPPLLAMRLELKPAQTKVVRSSGASPRMKLRRAVKLSGRSTALISAVSRHGVRWIAVLIRISNWSQSSSSSWNWSRWNGITSRLGLRLEAAHHQPADLLL